MKLVWMMIVMATGAMFVIAATLVAKPFDLDGQSSFGRDNGIGSVAVCFFCGGSRSEEALQRASNY